MSKADQLISAMREQASDALTNADTFTASDFSCVMTALAENFQALDAEMLKRNTPAAWAACGYCEAHGCALCNYTALACNNPKIAHATEQITICGGGARGTVERIRRLHDGTDQHFVRWHNDVTEWYVITPTDTVENFCALAAMWGSY